MMLLLLSSHLSYQDGSTRWPRWTIEATGRGSRKGASCTSLGSAGADVPALHHEAPGASPCE